MMNSLQTKLKDNILHVSIDLNKYNSFGIEFLDEFIVCLDLWEADDNVSSILLTGNELAFCTGADPKLVAGYAIEEGADFLYRIDELLYRVYYYSKPVVTMLTGHALGGGLSIALASDYSISSNSDRIKIGFPEYRLGLSLTVSMRELLQSRVHLTMYDVLTGRNLCVFEALKTGLINEISNGDIKAKCCMVCNELTQIPKHSFGLFKAHFKNKLSRPYRERSLSEYQELYRQIRSYATKRLER